MTSASYLATQSAYRRAGSTSLSLTRRAFRKPSKQPELNSARTFVRRCRCPVRHERSLRPDASQESVHSSSIERVGAPIASAPRLGADHARGGTADGSARVLAHARRRRCAPQLANIYASDASELATRGSSNQPPRSGSYPRTASSPLSRRPAGARAPRLAREGASTNEDVLAVEDGLFEGSSMLCSGFVRASRAPGSDLFSSA